MPLHPVSVRMTRNTLERLDAATQLLRLEGADDWSRSAIINQAVEQWLERFSADHETIDPADMTAQLLAKVRGESTL